MTLPAPAAGYDGGNAPGATHGPAQPRSVPLSVGGALGWAPPARMLAHLVSLLLLAAAGWSAISGTAPPNILTLYLILMATAGGLALVSPHRGPLAVKIIYLAVSATVAFAVNLLAGAFAGRDARLWVLYLLYYFVASLPLLLLPLRVGLAVLAGVWLLLVVNVLIVAHWDALPYSVPRGLASLSLGFLLVMVFAHVSRQAQERGEQIADLNRMIRTLHDDLEAARGRLQDFTNDVEEIAAIRERNRMAQELHDTLGHHLTVLNVQLEAALRLFATDSERSYAQIVRAKESAASALRDVRAAVTTLRPRQLDQRSLNAALERLVANFSTATGLPVDLTISGPARVAAAQEAVLYRTVQEALTNIQKHAKATRASVTLRYTPTSIELTVADNGAGSADPTGGMGLTGIRERAESVGGTMSVRTWPGAGLILHVSLPAGGAGGGPAAAGPPAEEAAHLDAPAVSGATQEEP